MSYSDQTTRRSPVSIAAVVGVHLAIGYALINGLAYQVLHGPPIIPVTQYPEDPPPPPPLPDPTIQKTKPTSQPVSTQPPRPELSPTKTSNDPRETVVEVGGGGSDPGPFALDPPPPPRPSLARSAVPGGDRLRWITTDDYPASALRQGIAGVVAIAVTIGADGRVQSCDVTASSGSKLLDDTTCRLFARRAHFTPALDNSGNPVPARRTDRFRWEIPN